MKDNPENDHVVVKFRPRKAVSRRNRQTESHESNIDRLLALSKYEVPRVDRDEFRLRMTENIAAAIILGLLVTVATVDLADLERIQQFARP